VSVQFGLVTSVCMRLKRSRGSLKFNSRQRHDIVDDAMDDVDERTTVCTYEPYRVFTRSSRRPANVQQLARAFWIHLLEVCWTLAGSCKHPIKYGYYSYYLGLKGYSSLQTAHSAFSNTLIWDFTVRFVRHKLTARSDCRLARNNCFARLSIFCVR